MKKQIEVLVKLQNIETETLEIKSTLNNVSKRLEKLDFRVKEYEHTLEKKALIIKELKKQYRDFESNVQMNLEKRKKTQAKLRSVKTNKEYQSLLKEIEDVQGKNSEIEDKMIECLDHIDETKKIIDKKKDEYKKISVQVKTEKESIEREAELGEKKLAELDMERKKVSSLIDSELLKKYLTIKEQDQHGIAIVPVKDAVCHGCNVNLPPQLYNELFRCDSLRFCPNCQRIIYLEDS